MVVCGVKWYRIVSFRIGPLQTWSMMTECRWQRDDLPEHCGQRLVNYPLQMSIHVLVGTLGYMV